MLEPWVFCVAGVGLLCCPPYTPVFVISLGDKQRNQTNKMTDPIKQLLAHGQKRAELRKAEALTKIPEYLEQRPEFTCAETASLKLIEYYETPVKQREGFEGLWPYSDAFSDTKIRPFVENSEERAFEFGLLANASPEKAKEALTSFAEDGATPNAWILNASIGELPPEVQKLYPQILEHWNRITAERVRAERKEAASKKSIELRGEGLHHKNSPEAVRVPNMIAQLNLFSFINYGKHESSTSRPEYRDRDQIDLELSTSGKQVRSASYVGPQLTGDDFMVLLHVLVAASQRHADDWIPVSMDGIAADLFGCARAETRQKVRQSFYAMKAGQLKVEIQANVSEGKNQKKRAEVHAFTGALVKEIKEVDGMVAAVQLHSQIPSLSVPGLFFTTSIQCWKSLGKKMYAKTVLLAAQATHNFRMDRSEFEEFVRCGSGNNRELWRKIREAIEQLKSAKLIDERSGVNEKYISIC